MTIDTDFKLSSYVFDLPEKNIAQSPSENRDDSRLLIYSKKSKKREFSEFKNILDFLPISESGLKPLFIANNSKVVPARLFGTSAHGGKRELLLLTPPPILEQEAMKSGTSSSIAEVLLKPSKSAKTHDIWEFTPYLKVEILEKFEFGKTKVRLHWTKNITEIFEEFGHLPLPPYIRRSQNTEEDKKRYQTIYANSEKAGSVAAPTAGLHFTPELKQSLLDAGCLWEEVTLHVGYGTFTPVRVDDIRQHPMHSEYFEISPSSVQAILQAKQDKRPIIAVGTTSCRVLEGCAEKWNNKENSLLPIEGMLDSTNVFIYPHKDKAFQVIDALITNFHLPESSLLMLVSAFCSRSEMLDIYEEAIKKDFRFFSYGDAMLIKA